MSKCGKCTALDLLFWELFLRNLMKSYVDQLFSCVDPPRLLECCMDSAADWETVNIQNQCLSDGRHCSMELYLQLGKRAQCKKAQCKRAQMGSILLNSA